MNRWRWIFLCIGALISLLGDLFLLHDPSHDVWWNHIPAFFAFFGFTGCMLIIFLAKFLGKAFLSKKEDYYDAP